MAVVVLELPSMSANNAVNIVVYLPRDYYYTLGEIDLLWLTPDKIGFSQVKWLYLTKSVGVSRGNSTVWFALS